MCVLFSIPVLMWTRICSSSCGCCCYLYGWPCWTWGRPHSIPILTFRVAVFLLYIPFNYSSWHSSSAAAAAALLLRGPLWYTLKYILHKQAAVAGGTIAMRYLHTVWCSLAKEAKNKSVFWWMHSFIADRVISQWMKLLCCGLGGSGCRTGIGQWRVFVGVESRVFIARPFIQVESFAASFMYSYRGKEENNTTTTGNHYCNFKRQVGEVEVSQWRWGGRTFREKRRRAKCNAFWLYRDDGTGKKFPNEWPPVWYQDYHAGWVGLSWSRR